MLHRRRERLRELAEREAAGESFWTSEFDDRVRTKIHHLFHDLTQSRGRETACKYARDRILRDEGFRYLHDDRLTTVGDLLSYLAYCDSEMMPTVVEALHYGLDRGPSTHHHSGTFGELATKTFREHRIAFDLIEGQMVPYSSAEMHESVVMPTLRLLARTRGERPGVENAYQDALREISAGNPADAITDAGTSLQLLLEDLGCAGNALGPLIRSAKAKGLLAAHDSPMIESIERLLHWVSADRSESGDAHSTGTLQVDDAWLVVHVVGAIIIRLAEDRVQRGSSS